MKFLSALKRKYYFFTYNIKPFRLSLILAHARKRFFSALGFRKGFRIIDLALTYDCNLNCEHCSALIMRRSDSPMLTLDDYRRIVDEAKQLDVLSWNITGGEPLLVPWLDELIPVLEPQTHYVSLQTNCMLLTRERARELRRLGVSCITTSLDSIDPPEHNKFRGNSWSYQKVMEGIENAREAGLRVLVGGTITHQNLRSDELKQLIEEVNKNGAIFLYNLAVPCGNWQGKEDMLLQGNDREYLHRLLDKYPMSSTDHEVGRNAIGCPAGTEKVYITPYGEVIPCPFIHVTFGNVRERSLQDIVSSMRQIPYFDRYQKICIAAEDHDFQKEVLARLGTERLPVEAKVVFKDVFYQ